MLHVMPDKTVRVTSRFPDGRSTVYFDLEHGDGVTIEQDRSRPETCILRMLHGYRNFTARYGDAAEAAADFADLTTMLADRHCPPPHPSLPASTSYGGAKRKGWGWKGALAGLVVGVIGSHLAPNWRTADASAIHAAASGDAVPRLDPRPDGDVIPTHGSLPPRLAAPAPIPVAPATPQAPSRTPAPASSFGLQP